MARKFITTKEYSLISKINKELIQNFSGQDVIYYAISREHTQVDDIYGEAVEKFFLDPVILNCRVAYDNPVVKTTEIGTDSEYTLEVYVMNDELLERNLVPMEGDFVEFGQTFYEISSVTQPQLVFGHVDNKLMRKLVCVTSREVQFAAGAYSGIGAEDNSHPVQRPVPRDPRR
jgi:hypothetical protein